MYLQFLLSVQLWSLMFGFYYILDVPSSVSHVDYHLHSPSSCFRELPNSFDVELSQATSQAPSSLNSEMCNE